jgi:hypothetical protein
VSSTTAFDLHRMLQQVTPHMATDEILPAIACIRLEARAGHLFATATDRYTMATARTPIIEEADWQAFIPAEDVPTVTAWLKAASTTTINVTGSIDGDLTVLTLTGNGGTLRVAGDTRSYGNPLNWRTMMRSQLDAELVTAPLTGFTTKYLARWQHAGKTLSGWQAAPGKALILMDDAGDFIGMQMPISSRHLDRDDMKAQWASALTHLAYVDGQSYSLDVQWSDAQGDPWEYTGQDRRGEPLMRVVGIDGDDHTLSDLLAQYGPLTPIPA